MMELKKEIVRAAIMQNLKSIVQDLPNFKCMVGIPAGEINTKAEAKYKRIEDKDIAYYAAENEFGVFTGEVKIPARPFLRTTFEGENVEKLSKKAQVLLNRCAEENRNAEGYLNQIGLYASTLVQRNIREGDWEPNAPLTVFLKGSSKPLIDTGTMRRAVTSWVTKK